MLAIILSILAMNIIGMLWYSKRAFGLIWMKELNIDPESIDKEAKNKEMKKLLFVNIVFTAISVFFLYTIIYATNLNLSGVVFAWFAFALLPFSNPMIWERKSKKVFLINAGCNLVSVLVASIIILNL